MRLRFSVLGIALFVFGFSWVGADERCASPVAQIVSLQGRVEVTPVDERRWRSVGLREKFCAGDRIRIEAYSRALVQLQDNTLLHLDGGTLVTFSGIEPNKPSWFELLKGAIHLISRFPHRLEVKTPFVNAAVEGTEFAIRVEPEKALLWVFEGRVLFHNPTGQLTVTSGEAAVAEAGQAPRRRLVIQPREAVQWALYYPPLIDLRPSVYPSGPEAQGIHVALRAYRDGDLLTALGRLEQVPIGAREASYFTLQAALLLVVGRIDEARPNIQRALQLDPDHGTAYALQAIIALAQNRKEDALRLARQGAKLDPQSSIPQIALSYVYQGRFNIEQALQHAQQATELFPGEALAWARVAELQLSLGDLDGAAKAAQQAVALDPDLARTQTVRGFAELTAIDIEEAKASFQRAIELDPADPLSRLGLGLAKIRQGDLKAGTEEIEIAASLDPNNSLIRSYLGKAYYDQKRGEAAATELAIAKELDPNDPTPWFYDAIRKQTTNRPVEALHDMQKAIELNDNRAVYRSRLLMDQDLAARSASLGRIYNDLGFQQRGLLEGWKSVNTDPSNYSAHRLLADNYAALPRHEIARVSELLQSQLLQPLNLTPVQPSLAESNLLLLEGAGPSGLAFNEFNPLFTRNRLALQASGVFGSNDTLGDEVTQSGLWKNFSYSVGQFHSETDGFRENSDFARNTYNVFTQGALSPNTNLQAEFRHDERIQGDLALRFDPNFSKVLRETSRVNTYRLGARHAFSPNSQIIASLSYQNVNVKQKTQTQRTISIPTPLGPLETEILIPTEATINRNGFIGELQHFYTNEKATVISGFGHINNDVIQNVTFPENKPPLTEVITHPDIRKVNIYNYSQIRAFDKLTAILGLSIDSLEIRGQLDKTQVNPKFGLIWMLHSSTTLRLAGFRSMSTTRTANQTIEQTQVAGFNQFFDDVNGTDAWRYGAAVDHVFSKYFYGGVEYSERKLDVPVLISQGSKAQFVNWKEKTSRTYFYLTPNSNFAASIEYFFERFDRRSNPLRTGIVDVATHRVPVGLSFFHPLGFSANLKATYVNQSGFFQRRNSDDIFNDQSGFIVVDMSLNYRLPKRFGIIRVGSKNLFNERFKYQDMDPNMPLFFPERFLYTQLTLAF
ncbi:TPR repeat protein [Nitrosococcus oceani ATCC 19707]|uniref:TPR repeat protein n=2 Tax=Nitrosococcus oceani TaxID=1229 RepID=Q3JC75_NITOC|nr:tetratricopeptide repeat protein [Nitrosococcus oceani]ABA57571.1 TPR repeat protein [Nitrosococcus oceani ATCC 19707]EDZ67753.1 tetratricopeptide repeat domain protein [Nitrosococcus oceani AFC27]KFI20071.1 TonB-dependent receptor [Nitrosococcus oceani C-27]GEM20640.1 TonB-dependent receptor [Nitrosococcus oceani]